MDEILQATYFTSMIASKTNAALSADSRAAIDDIQSYCHELKCCKRPTKFVKCLKDLFLFEMLLGLLDSLLLEPSVPVVASAPPEITKAPNRMVQRKTADGQNLWKPFYLDDEPGRRPPTSTPSSKTLPKSCHTELATQVLQLWLALVQACTTLSVPAVYFDDIKHHILHPRFSLIFERWLYNPTAAHVSLHVDLCAALVAIIVYLHNHPFFDASCFLQAVTANKTIPIRTCLSSFFEVVSSFPPHHTIHKTFANSCCLEIKFIRPDDLQPTPAPIGTYQQAMDALKFGSFAFDESYFKTVTSKPPSNRVVVPGAMRRLNQELAALPDNLPLHEGSMIALRVDEEHPHKLSVLITGPSKTPYDSGCFHFLIVVPDTYPQAPPTVKFMTTGGGSVRFSPNLYNCGKVCLSLLGTWTGDPWNPVTSTILQVLVSIQGAILGAELPYYNEPGRERQWSGAVAQLPRDVRVNENGGLEPLRLATVRFAWTMAMKQPALGFESLVLEHFWLKRHYVLGTMKLWLEEARASDTPNYYDDMCRRVAECLDELTPLVEVRATKLELAMYHEATAPLKARFPVVLC
ncbi:hypothetical protein DYB37_009202 [Aphanomyces astaci]|uniref:UBC core domain-containing protein n=1 Tax=Aphanomyces astaci TaxID=112090 RepID=A0A3R7ASV4_APHAT|nr:hypothetical protein DYB35_009185 [Aphanomyces astaci]RHZ14545.1 hypothetical protein DYB37_009202 [Aphanomyces astaci]